MVCAALIVLLSLGRIDEFVALVIIGREIAVSALREWMAQISKSATLRQPPGLRVSPRLWPWPISAGVTAKRAWCSPLRWGRQR